MMSPEDAIAVMRKAGGCADCFESDLGLHKAFCDTPQPRWIGERYFSSRPRVVVVLINPGGGGTSADPSLAREAEFFREFYRTGDYDRVREYFQQHINRGDRWWIWYRDVFGLIHEEIAQINIAWCPTQENLYPTAMLRHCFAKHTSPLIQTLAPDVVLLSGSVTHRFSKAVKSLLPAADIIPTWHYAHRKARTEEATEGDRVRRLIGEAKRR